MSIEFVGTAFYQVFFAHSLLSKLASPQPAQLSLIRKVSKHGTSMRDLIKDAPLIDRKKKSPASNGIKLEPLGHNASPTRNNNMDLDTLVKF